MQTMIQNIFMDQKSYELIQKNQDFEHICSVILNGVDTDKPQPQTIIINKIEFQAEFHPKNDYFGFTFTKEGYIISAIKSVGLKTVYIYIHQPLWKSMMKIFPVPLYFYTLPKNTSMSLLMEKTA